MSEETKRSPSHAPDYALHRYVKDANDTPPETVKAHGINMHGFQSANIQVIPDANDPNPSIEVFFWSEKAAAFVSEHSALAFAGKGAGEPYEVTVECNGRVMFVSVIAGVAATQDCRIYVSGFNERRK